MSSYPEHEKLEKIVEFSQTCGEFLEWLNSEKGVMLAVYSNARQGDDQLYRYDTSISDLLAEFFEIDQDKLEAEKLAMLAQMRSYYQKEHAEP